MKNKKVFTSTAKTLSEMIKGGLIFKSERDTFYVTVHSKPDDKNQQSFEMEWISNNIGEACNETGLRCQMFFGGLSEHTNRHSANGKK